MSGGGFRGTISIGAGTQPAATDIHRGSGSRAPLADRPNKTDKQTHAEQEQEDVAALGDYTR
jgi:hypothetical protein